MLAAFFVADKYMNRGVRVDMNSQRRCSEPSIDTILGAPYENYHGHQNPILIIKAPILYSSPGLLDLTCTQIPGCA